MIHSGGMGQIAQKVSPNIFLCGLSLSHTQYMTKQTKKNIIKNKFRVIHIILISQLQREREEKTKLNWICWQLTQYKLFSLFSYETPTRCKY